MKTIPVRARNRRRVQKIIFAACLVVLAALVLPPASNGSTGEENAQYIILMIADGWGQKHIEAANKYRRAVGEAPPVYQTDPAWTRYFMTTFPYGGSYDPWQAASDFTYLLNGAVTDSAAAATALFTSTKTSNGRISVSYDGNDRLYSIKDEAWAFGKAVGAVTSVPVSHATPGAWIAHNDDRGNGYAISDEGFFGDPATTGLPEDAGYAGGHGPSDSPADVIIGDRRAGYVNSAIREKLLAESGSYGKHYLVERRGGVDGGAALLETAGQSGVTRLAGLYDLFYRNADGRGGTAADRFENPTLAESTLAALTVLGRDPEGFVLMIEGGAIDWSGHANNMDQMIGEMKGFDEAVQTVIDWVEDTGNGSNWSNTLVIVTGDHECGYLTRNRGVLPNVSLGTVDPLTVAEEKIVKGTEGRRASWDDTNGNGFIDNGETVHWSWNSNGHSNSVIPMFTRGAGSGMFASYISGYDLLFESSYIDNSAVFTVMYDAMASCTQTGSISIASGQTLSGNPVDLTSLVTEENAAAVTYTVRGGSCSSQTGSSVIQRRSTWKYDIENTGTAWINRDYDDSGWASGSGVFGTETNAAQYGYAITTPVSNTSTSMFFRKTFTICDPLAVTGITLNALFDDALVVYINGTQVYRKNVVGNPPAFNGDVTAWREAKQYETVDLARAVGISTLRGLLVPGSGNVIAVGVYNDMPASSDIVWDGELLISSSASEGTLFSGGRAQAVSVDTSGWPEGSKTLDVTGNDADCGTPFAETGEFMYR